MKNNKYVTYAMGILVILIWSTIFYKIYVAIMGEEVAVPPVPQNYFAQPADTSAQNANFALILDYNDPFLGKKGMDNKRNYKHSHNTAIKTNGRSNNNTISTKNINKNPNQTSKNNPKTIQNRTVTPPPITYQGIQIHEGDTIALMRINGRFYPNVRQGEKIGNVAIERIFRDSLHAVYQNQPMTVLRKGR